MKKIVFLTGNYHPNHSAVSNCVEKVVTEISDEYEVIVLTLKNNLNDLDEEYYKNHKIIRVNYVNEIKGKKNKIIRRINRIKNKYSLNQEIINAFTSKLNEIENMDLLIPASMPFETVFAANSYKNKNPKTLLVPYLFDPYIENENLFYNVFLKKIKSNYSKKLEYNIMKNSEKVILMNHLKKNFDNKYSELKLKFEFVEHPLLIPNISNEEEKKGDFNFVYTGSFYKKIRNPKMLIKVFKLVISELKNSKMNIYSFGDCEELLIKEVKGAENNIVLNGSVSMEESVLKMKEADFLIAVGNTTSSQSPSKIFEYMSFGKPIIYFLNNYSDRNIDVLSKYPLSLIVDKNLNEYEAKKLIIQFVYECIDSKIDVAESLASFKDAIPKYTASKIEKVLNM